MQQHSSKAVVSLQWPPNEAEPLRECMLSTPLQAAAEWGLAGAPQEPAWLCQLYCLGPAVPPALQVQMLRKLPQSPERPASPHPPQLLWPEQ